MGFIIQISYGVTGGSVGEDTFSARELFGALLKECFMSSRPRGNMMLHFFAAALTLLVAALFRVTCLELAVPDFDNIRLFSYVNWLIQPLRILCDIVCADIEPRIRRVKDIAAGAVLVSAVSAVIVGILVLGPTGDFGKPDGSLENN